MRAARYASALAPFRCTEIMAKEIIHCAADHSVNVYLTARLVIPNSWPRLKSAVLPLNLPDEMQTDPAQSVERAFYPSAPAAALAKRKVPLALLTGEGRGFLWALHSLIFVSPAESSPLFKTRSENSFL